MKHYVFWILIVSSSLQAMSSRIKEQIWRHTVLGQKEIAVVVPTYNNEWHGMWLYNLNSILDQEYHNFHVYLINDCSTDRTAEFLQRYLDFHPRGDYVTLINNKKRVGAMANFYRIIHDLPDHVIVVNVDGDDELAHRQVLAHINHVYSDYRVWLTYGQYREYPNKRVGFCQPFPKDVIARNAYRQFGFPVSHLRTYYAWLFKRIDKKDLMYNGTFVQTTCDKVMMAPMIEMCGGRFKCLDDILYVYHINNPISDMHIHGKMQAAVRDWLFEQPPYEPLDDIITDFASDAEQ